MNMKMTLRTGLRTAICTAALAAAAWMLGEPRAASGPAGTRTTDKHSGIPPIVFVGAPMFDERTDGGEGVYQGSYHWRDGYIYARSATYNRPERTMGPVRPGKNLYFYDPARPDAAPRQLTFLKTGAVFKPEPSFDGRRVLFSMKRDGEDWFNLYEMNVDGSGLRQLTDGPFNDFAGVYLPDGRIVFVSDRTGYLEEYHEERTECLFVMNGDGTGIHQITFMPGTYFEPTVLRDGRIMFSFWDAFHIDVPPLDKHETFLMTVNPDGTEERHLFGAGEYQFFNRERHSGVGITQAHEMPDGRILCQTELGPSLIDLSRGSRIADALWPIFPGTTSVQLGGTTHRVHLSPLGTRSAARPLPDGRVLFSATRPGARDSAVCVVDPTTREEQVVLNIPNFAEFDAVPVLIEREKPRRLPEQIKQPAAYRGGDPEAFARFLVVAGRDTDNPSRTEAMKRARYLRVVEAEYTGVTTSSHTNLATRILGVVPLFPDGSAYFEAPADTPLFLDALDGEGNRLLHAWSYPETSVPMGRLYPVTQMGCMTARAGEVKSCYGCHAPPSSAVPDAAPAALRCPPVRICREASDVEYRRNEPENYRLRARVGEWKPYLDWLKKEDAALRARGCERLADYPEAAAAIVEPLGNMLLDQNADVRRAAAFALGRVGGIELHAADGPVPALARLHKLAEADADPLVRLVASHAADAIRERTRHDFVLRGIELTRERPSGGVVSEKREPGTDQAALDAIRTAGRLKLRSEVANLAAYLKMHDWEYHAAEAAVALGRIGSPEAIEALWQALRTEVPSKQVVYARYLQHGPRPEEYALLKGLVLADARPRLDDVHLLIALLPNAFMEKPRFEDRLRDESQRVLMPRVLLERAGFRKPIVDILLGKPGDERLKEQVLKGINLERPFSEHGRPFPVVKDLGAEEKLWLLTCLAERGEVPEDFAIPHLRSSHHRERIDAAVLLGQQGFTQKGAEALATELRRPYAFPEIASIGKGMPDENFRDKAYMVMALAMHIQDVNQLRDFADAKTMYRDVRYGLVRGLARRGKPDAIPLLLELATRDPLTLIRQQARYGVADIQEGCKLQGVACPPVDWPQPEPLEKHYFPPRGLAWADKSPDPAPAPQAKAAGVLEQIFPAGSFRNLSMAQARGADRLMIHGVAEAEQAFSRSAGPRSPDSQGQLAAALDLPYPYANYLALSQLGRDSPKDAASVLLARLEAFARSGNTVGFWWACEALGQIGDARAIPVLARLAQPANPGNTFGPLGMPLGYPAARALGRIARTMDHVDVARLLRSENAWLRAGVLRGLAEADAPQIEEELRRAALPDQPAMVRAEANVQLARREPRNAASR